MSEINNGSRVIISNVTRINIENKAKDEKFKEINLPLQNNECLNCPNAMWFYKNSDIYCHCRVMNTIEYKSSIDINIRFCAGKFIT